MTFPSIISKSFCEGGDNKSTLINCVPVKEEEMWRKILFHAMVDPVGCKRGGGRRLYAFYLNVPFLQLTCYLLCISLVLYVTSLILAKLFHAYRHKVFFQNP